ncbi:MAG: hypothetical protein F7B17_08145 [Desulfurococcales archaeon]|nr:hypothetical protein [Desulfurococcales archaeon]
MSLEDRLERLERMLSRVLEKLERLERIVGMAGDEARLAMEVATAFAIPAQEAVAAAKRIAKVLSSVEGEVADDGIARAIVEALAVNGPMTLRGLEREVRRLRGTASRSVIRERVRRLEELGVVEVERRGRRMVIRLAGDEEGGRDSRGPGSGV